MSRGKRLEGKVQVRLKWNKAPSCSLKVAPFPLQLAVTPREAAQNLEVCSPIRELKKKGLPFLEQDEDSSVCCFLESFEK